MIIEPKLCEYCFEPLIEEEESKICLICEFSERTTPAHTKEIAKVLAVDEDNWENFYTFTKDVILIFIAMSCWG